MPHYSFVSKNLPHVTSKIVGKLDFRKHFKIIKCSMLPNDHMYTMYPSDLIEKNW